MIASQTTIYIKDIPFSNAKDMLSAISYGGELYDTFNGNFIFRGHSDDRYKLLPTALRSNLYLDTLFQREITDEHYAISLSEYGQIEAEASLLWDFFKKCDNTHLYVPEERCLRDSFIFPFDYQALLSPEIWIAEEYQELAALAQHNGVPTRLLDWTTEICVSLYFASSSVLREKATPSRYTREEWLSEINSTYNIIKESRKGNSPIKHSQKYIEIWALDTAVLYADKKMSIPLQIARPRYLYNNNLAAQKGIFTYWSVKKPLKRLQDKSFAPDFSVLRNDKALDEQIETYLTNCQAEAKPYLYRLTCPQEDFLQVFEYAVRNHCDAAHLFPGYKGVAQGVEEELFYKKMKVRSRVSK